ncbi:amine sulfotransferase-like isoform X1 [Dendronephthya gigantea]|uniref:amine sulfotransferase-like isoform X1 n=1 Tax=Dendronephthya gigantea TaxID=151771 RepID=UPI00106CF90B|nr:amine sulfotransferase-like isoform X1 [Dendronephthya gigantea]
MTSEKSPVKNPEIQVMKQRISKFFSEHGRLYGLNFKPRSDDVFVVTWPKCGTTWMQQILHQLRSGGDMSFDEISDVVPSLEGAYDTERDLEAEHNFQPRCYKTHAWYPDCPKGAKYIVIYREPCACFSSGFNYLKGWFFQPGEISLHEFVVDYALPRELINRMGPAPYFAHLLSWWEHRDDPNVLFLFFEDMKDDLESAVRKVASFIGIEDDERIKKAVQMSSFEFMKSNERKFSSAISSKYRNKICGVADETVVRSKVVTGSATKGREMMDEKTKEMIQAKWNEVVWKQTGFQDYQELRNAFKKQNE